MCCEGSWSAKKVLDGKLKGSGVGREKESGGEVGLGGVALLVVDFKSLEVTLSYTFEGSHRE